MDLRRICTAPARPVAQHRAVLPLGDQRDAFEIAREHACAIYRDETGKVWRPRTGSHTARTATLTAAAIKARDCLCAREQADTQDHLPDGTLIALAPGSHAFDDANLVWDLLDRVRAKHPVMVLVHGGGKSPTRNSMFE